MSSSSPPRSSGDEYDQLMNSSPIAPSPAPAQPRGQVRRRGDRDDEDSDPNPFVARVPPLNLRASAVNQSDMAELQNFARGKKLKREHVDDVVKFMNLPSGPVLHEGYMYATQLATLEEVRRVVSSQPPWAPSKDFIVNVRALSFGTLLSTSARAYKGNVLNQSVLKIIYERRFDLPSNIATIPADKAKVSKVVSDQMSEARSAIKKDIGASVNYDPKKNPKPSLNDAAKHMGLKALADLVGRHLGDGFDLTPSFCARVALLRHVYMKDNGKKFWDNLEDDIEGLHVKAQDKLKTAGNKPNADKIAAKVTKAFKGLLDKDRRTHGDTESNKTDGIDSLVDGVDALQTVIDQTLARTSGTSGMGGSGTGAEEPEEQSGSPQ
ncbi:hypothetical protein B0H11DRAFT_2281267 [Mycena galericulata]|nr:hypothetical protein B0H11DRAFT_2281267 [Mycena galericulata]